MGGIRKIINKVEDRDIEKQKDVEELKKKLEKERVKIEELEKEQEEKRKEQTERRKRINEQKLAFREGLKSSMKENTDVKEYPKSKIRFGESYLANVIKDSVDKKKIMEILDSKLENPVMADIKGDNGLIEAMFQGNKDTVDEILKRVKECGRYEVEMDGIDEEMIKQC